MLYSEILADFIFNLQYENIPNTVVQRAKELMLDSLGTAIAASKEECVLNAFKAFENLSTEKNTPVWVHDKKLDPIYAAMLNALLLMHLILMIRIQKLFCTQVRF